MEEKPVGLTADLAIFGEDMEWSSNLSKKRSIMFAPKVAKPQTQAAESSTSRLAAQRSRFAARAFGGKAVERVHMLQSVIGNQATLRLLTERTLSVTENEPTGDHEQGVTPENMTAREARRGASWDFSKILIHPPDRPNRLADSSNSDADPGPADVDATQQDMTSDTESLEDLVGPSSPACVNPGRSRAMYLQPVFLRASAADSTPTGTSWNTRYALAAAVWSKLGVSVGARDAVTLDTPLKTAGGDNHEANQVAALRSAADVEVFLVDNDMSWGGGGMTYGSGAGSQIVMSDRGTSQTLLGHELGHVLGLGHPPAGADADTVMQGSGSNSVSNPTRNTMGNYRRITWPRPAGKTCLFPDK